MKMNKNMHAWPGLVGTALATVLALSGHAQTSFWIAPGGGNLHDAANWSLGTPVVEHTLCFTNPASYAITNASYFNLRVDSLFNASSGTVTYVGNVLRVQAAIKIGTVLGATATVDFVKGTIDAPYGHIYVGRDGGRGHMRMRGDMGRIYTYYDADIGTRSDGNTLEVRDGAYFYKINNPTAMRVGNNGSGNTLLIAAGGAVTNWAYFYVGLTSTDTSNRVVVCDSGSSLALDGGRTTQVGRYGYYNERVLPARSMSARAARALSSDSMAITAGCWCRGAARG